MMFCQKNILSFGDFIKSQKRINPKQERLIQIDDVVTLCTYDEVGQGLFESAMHNDFDAVYIILEREPKSIDYTDSKGISILAIAFARGRDFFEFILERRTDQYFLQYLLCHFHFRVNATSALEFFVTEFKASYEDDFRFGWTEAKRLNLDKDLQGSLQFVADYYEENHEIKIYEIINEEKDESVNTHLINMGKSHKMLVIHFIFFVSFGIEITRKL